MNQEALRKLEYHTILSQVEGYAMSYRGRAHIEAMHPHTDLDLIRRMLRETEEAVGIVASGGSVPIPSLDGMDKVESLLGKGYLLSAEEIAKVYQFLEGTAALKKYMKMKLAKAPLVASFAERLDDVQRLMKEIERCIEFGGIADDASTELAKIRKKLRVIRERLKKRVDALVQKYSRYLQETIVRERGGRYVLAVQKNHRRMIQGTVLDESSSGQTVFMEPAELASIQQELAEYEADEAREEMQILSRLTGLVEQHEVEIRENLYWIGYYDFVFARAKYCHHTNGMNVDVNGRGVVRLRDARHPLLRENAVPLQFEIGDGYRSLVITGPNTGGKTVTLKTVGLLCAMVQSGLLIPVSPDSQVSVYQDILVDIGDGQSLNESLSTFSAHVRNIIEILKVARPNTLVLLDELATGTDPGEGVGLSIAVLEELYNLGSTIVATTHFNEIKQFASLHPGFENARMEFDEDSLQPQYRLTIGQPGNSYAFLIAKKLGIEERLIQRARAVAGTRSQAGQIAMDVQPSIKPMNASTDRGKERIPSVPKKQPAPTKVSQGYQVGDRVWVHALKRSAIVAEVPDDKGQMVVIIQKQRHKMNAKRVSPFLTKDQLYPENYDLDIVLDSKDARKKRKLMQKRHVPGLSIETNPEP